MADEDGARARSAPLASYGALGDGRSVALVGADGSVDWWCAPNMDSEPLFDRLLDPQAGGRFAITPTEPFRTERRYREDSNVLELDFITARGHARITNSLNSGISGRLPWSELARRVEGIEGEVPLRVELLVGRRLDRATPWRETSPHGEVMHLDGLLLALRADEAMRRTEVEDGCVVAELRTTPGSRAVVALLVSADEPLILPPLAQIDGRIDRSDTAWREWCGNLKVDMPYAAAVKRSALALKLLLYSPTGAIAAAATTSLPEQIGGPKNYDYRFAWVRDVDYSIKAFLRVSATEEAKAAFSWLTATIERHGGRIRTMYALDGALAPDEVELDLPGYADSRPVHRGNVARSQLQLGVFGDMLETATLFVSCGHVLDLRTRRLLADLTDRCADLWRGRDSGIWELREPQHFTMSKIGCWTAMDRAVTLAEQGQIDNQHAARWARERDRIRDWIDAECWSEAKQAYVMYPGTDKLDASILLATRFGFERRDRLASTRDAIVRELSRGPLVYRYSGMEAEEGTFLACAFWLVEAYALLGDQRAAIRQMDALMEATGGNLGLLTEQMGEDGTMLGNMPQALSHLALVHAAASIAEAEGK